jgi:hypothetical protein
MAKRTRYSLEVRERAVRLARDHRVSYLSPVRRTQRSPRVRPLSDEGADAYAALTPAERVALVWPLTVSAWSVMHAARGEQFDAESRLQRNHLRVLRRGS